MSDIFVSDRNEIEESGSRPPLFLQHYLDEREGRIFGEQVVKPPGPPRYGHVVERRENLIILEFREGPKARKSRRVISLRHLCRSWWDAAMLLLLIGSAVACVMSFLR